MANHKSAIKRHKQSLKKRDRNRTTKAAVRTAIKKTRAAAEAGDLESAKQLLVQAERLIAKASSKGMYHRKNAARKIGRLASLVSTKAAPTQATH